MNRIRTATVAAGAIALAAIAAAQVGGGFDLRHNNHAESSGGVSTSGQYTLFSSVGQPAVAISNPSTSGQYSLASGFLALPAAEEGPGDVWSVR